MRMHRHHLLEIILWPNGAGTFRKIINSAKRLRELEIYDDWKLTINIPADEHISLHARNRADATKAKISAAHKGKKFTAEHRAKLSAVQKGEKNRMYGKNLSEETKAKISAAGKGRKLSAEHRANISKGSKGRKFTAEHRAKLSAAHKGKIYKRKEV